MTVERDAHGVPRIRAGSVDDLVEAQGFVTAQDRLFQMDLLRRHAAGELAAILGPSVLGHDRLQRTLQIRAAADRAIAALPPAQLHLLERYAAGVNASIDAQRQHLPIQFRVLRYQPAPWTPRDSLLVALSMFEDLTNAFPTKLARESLTSRLPAATRERMEQDLYPVGSWRDHPPPSPMPDLTIEGPQIQDIPLDESQSSLRLPRSTGFVAAGLAQDAALLTALTSPELPPDPSLTPGSNEWVVSGAHTASGKPLLSNDMHLTHSLPGIWYEADLQAAGPDPASPFHAAGVSIPGLPLIVVGHNDHIAWGFTNLGADVQDVYVETTRGSGSAEEFQAADGSWQPVLHFSEPIAVKGAKTEAFEVLGTRHGDAITPILNPALTPDVTRPQGKSGPERTLSLRWTIQDAAALHFPFLAIDSATDWTSFLAAIREFGMAQNVVYADDRGHIGYHASGLIPLRGPAEKPKPDAALPADVATAESAPLAEPSALPSATNSLQLEEPPAAPQPTAPLLSGPLSPVPLKPSVAHEWSGYIPFDELPQVYDPPGGVIATANSRVTPDSYPYPLALNWAAPYRNERIWHVLQRSQRLTAADMLALQNDIDSEFDRVLAERLTYALDLSLEHPPAGRSAEQTRTLRQAADLLRTFKGGMATDSAAAAIVASVHATLWPMLLEPVLSPATAAEQTSRTQKASRKPDHRAQVLEFNALYLWGERDYALEQLLQHTPARWLPHGFANWNDFLTAATLRALADSSAPAELASWRFSAISTVEIEDPVFAQSEALRSLLGRPTGTGPRPQSGDATTVKQVGHSFGPSERFTADLAALDRSTLNLVLGQSGNPDSPYYMDQFPAWLAGTTFPLSGPPVHTLRLTP